ncbi:metalloendoproteinase 3-MMP-like [Cornus florida]|uniref:metalloendoproteinase 3-MMP-like n=1 Tax=Cornus florida TaxID=4283 RepID=UPI0028A2640C|nr:metalloendoproteinase 3-MMP-like [Cornus florida]
MAFNPSLLLGAFLLLLLVSIPITVHCKDHTGKSFDFLHHLEGCHKGQTVKGLHALKRYLQKFGYLNYGHDHHDSSKNRNLKHANNDEFDDLLESAVRAYQSNYHMKVTGILDSDTIQEMMLPRCGVPDVVKATNAMSSRKMKQSKLFNTTPQYSFFPGMPRWPPSKTRLTYSFRSSAKVVGIQVLRSVCSRAFRRWQNVSHFTFQEARRGATGDIVIGFHHGGHGDQYPFDGPGNTLAHAFAPQRGWFHYDADENWSTNPVNMTQVDLESVAVHEIGHILGLGHSYDRNAIMFPSFSPGTIKRNLRADDIEGIRALYS